jgi:multiple sugar transport system substrate-binding protein
MTILRILLIAISVITILLSSMIFHSSIYSSASDQNKKEQVTLTAILEDQGDPERWKTLIQPAMEEMTARHPDLDIKINYSAYPYDQAKKQMLDAISNQTHVDLISLDQIWVGEFAERGLLTDITDRVNSWGRISDLYESNLDGTLYNDRIYGIWAWTDVRGIWYWKDMLSQAGVNPKSLMTWDGYIESAKKLNSALRPQGVEGVHLTAASHSPDLWYPYLWMLGSYIIEPKDGHPTKGVYWFPAYNSSEAVKAMEFIKSQVDAGIRPQKEHYWGEEFLNRKFAVMIEALQHHIPISTPEKRVEFEQKVGFIPMFPVPSLDNSNNNSNNNKSATLMGGWALSIPSTSIHKDLAWELVTTVLEPKILAPYLAAHANLPTQIPIGEGNYSQTANNTIPYYSQLIGMIESGYNRPNIPEYPQIADHIRQALDEVFYGLKEPKEALDDAAAKSAKVLGWQLP